MHNSTYLNSPVRRAHDNTPPTLVALWSEARKGYLVMQDDGYRFSTAAEWATAWIPSAAAHIRDTNPHLRLIARPLPECLAN